MLKIGSTLCSAVCGFSGSNTGTGVTERILTTSSKTCLTPCPVAADMSITVCFLYFFFSCSYAFCAEGRSALLTTIIRGFLANSLSNCFNSCSMTLADCTASISSKPSGSTRCSSTRVRSMCFKNWCPSPFPSLAPSMMPGISAVAKEVPLCMVMPKLGLSVVNG